MKFSDYYIPTHGDVGYGDKGTVHSYLDSYDSLFAPYANTTKNILEIGVCRGHSISMLGKYFSSASIIGIDIYTHLIDSLEDPNNNIQIIKGDATQAKVLEPINNLEIVIDDGSHRLTDQITSFKLLWPKIVEGGLYVIEDIANITAFKRYIEQDTTFDSIDYELIDLRSIKNRYDDVLFVAHKSYGI